jgi:hypothetical protein
MGQSFAFQFKLREIEEITPWGKGADCKLHWFGLTDGIYWISTPLGNALHYTENARLKWQSDCPFVDYQVARIFEDVQQILPHALEAVPADIAEIISDPDWYAKGDAQFEKSPADSGFCKIWMDAVEWWGERHLDTLYLKRGPYFQFWRVEDRITIRWDSREEDESVWLAPKGEFSMDVNSFASSCYAFLDSVVEQMQMRVDSIVQNGWLREDCALDVPLLLKEQRVRAAAVQVIRNRRPNTDWNAVRERLKMVRQQSE